MSDYKRLWVRTQSIEKGKTTSQRFLIIFSRIISFWVCLRSQFIYVHTTVQSIDKTVILFWADLPMCRSYIPTQSKNIKKYNTNMHQTFNSICSLFVNVCLDVCACERLSSLFGSFIWMFTFHSFLFILFLFHILQRRSGKNPATQIREKFNGLYMWICVVPSHTQ